MRLAGRQSSSATQPLGLAVEVVGPAGRSELVGGGGGVGAAADSRNSLSGQGAGPRDPGLCCHVPLLVAPAVGKKHRFGRWEAPIRQDPCRLACLARLDGESPAQMPGDASIMSQSSIEMGDRAPSVRWCSMAAVFPGGSRLATRCVKGRSHVSGSSICVAGPGR